MKIVKYYDQYDKEFEIEYEENSLCIICDLPVNDASMGGTLVCPACDCGKFRDGTNWSYKEAISKDLIRKKAKEIEMRKNYELL